MEDTELFEVETIILTEDDGTEIEYAVLDKFTYEGKNYTILAEVEGDEVGVDEYLYAYEEDGEDMIISSVEDDAEYERVSKYYDSLGCDEN